MCDVAGGVCVRELGCVPASCEELRAQCGTIDDGCGTELDCGTCEEPEECGAGGVPNVCGCAPRGCDVGECGVVDNGCGALMDCGGCDAPATCEGNVCTCPSAECAPDECGDKPGGCGGTLDCGTCSAGETCGAGGPNRCGVGTCTPTTCGDLDVECGAAADGCGVVLDCGDCTGPETCGGGGTPGRCGCLPRTCATTARPAECGTVTEECGTTIDCGDCSHRGPNRVCVANVCECAADGYEPNDSHTSAATMGELAAGTRSLPGTNVHGAGNHDWYAFGLPGSLGETHTLSVSLGVAVGGDYDLRVVLECTDAGWSAAGFNCITGSQITSPHVGCESARSGSLNEAVSFNVLCDKGTVYAGVLVTSWSGACVNYPLSLTLASATEL